MFGQEVADVVQEVSDDKSLPQAERKRLQIECAPNKSLRARLIKIADKTSNVKSIANCPPKNWTRQQMLDYLDWTEAVINRMRGTNDLLESYYDQMLKETRSKLQQT